LHLRESLTAAPKDYCHVGGRDGGQENYGLPHVTGWLRLENGERLTTRCIFCGSSAV
jgi:hypothetical protein